MSLTNVIQQQIMARQDGLVVKELRDEVLVYDLRTHQAHCLNKTSVFVWEQCDGKTTVEEIANRMAEEWSVAVDINTVWFALQQLEQAGLLQSSIVKPAEITRISRRSAMQKLGLAASLPLVISVLAPTAVQAGASVPPTCMVCLDKKDGIGACTNTCNASVLGRCYANAGCGNGNEIGCATCINCFASGDNRSWRAPSDC
jgi:hypothetical protein